VPVPWSGTSPPFGFGPGAGAWLPQPADWAARTVEHQPDDAASTLALYRDGLRLRRQLGHAADPVVEWMATDPEVLAFRRPAGGLVCVVNVGDRPAAPPSDLGADTRPLLASAPPSADGDLVGCSTTWFAEGS
jgi:alpha-glucosidase